jgi:enoyl-CoA hydratase
MSFAKVRNPAGPELLPHMCKSLYRNGLRDARFDVIPQSSRVRIGDDRANEFQDRRLTATLFDIERWENYFVVRLHSADGTNRLTQACVRELAGALDQLASEREPSALVITGNAKFFSAGADLREIAELDGPAALEFSQSGQTLMNAIESFPAPVYASISGYCMGGGLDLALACHRRIAAPHAVFGHRGAALGLITGWGGTQRLPRLIGKGRALEMLVAAEKVAAPQAWRAGLVDAIADDPVAEAVHRISRINR